MKSAVRLSVTLRLATKDVIGGQSSVDYGKAEIRYEKSQTFLEVFVTNRSLKVWTGSDFSQLT